MTQQEKELLLKDLSARLPYGVKCTTKSTSWDGIYLVIGYKDGIVYLDCPVYGKGDDEWLIDFIIPYLRPLSSMTEDECKYCVEHFGIQSTLLIGAQKGMIMPMEASSMFIDWLNVLHFDYRGLIEKGLALEAPEGMYKQNKL